MSLQQSLSVVLIALALAACGEREFEPVVTAEGEAEPLPAPLPANGPVTSIPEPPASGTALLESTAPPPDAAAADEGPVAVIAFADGTLPPLEDNPETGLAPAPVDSATIAAGPAPDAAQAVAAVRGYYDAVQAGDLARAYAAWSDGGRASGRTPEQFAAGVEGLDILSVSVGETGRIEGAAGSRYVEIPVTVTSRGSDGREVRQVGAFVMRSSQVEGAAPGWYIASAELRELRP
ncbi:hypothetical protein [Luteimonas terricola]|uniref:Lipoprotein n=1 Tax=Luteimonas terricola TaxID=645597 RepID=A0ABQ2EH84_9GAMM|nr:hypothetical protein [Luteimonas terricola]GGK11445.1 hypothetical protein GCM10011394_20990 [Luteimonas terricola]